MLLFQFVKHGQPPTAPQPGAAHTSGLENWGWIFCPFGRGLVVLLNHYLAMDSEIENIFGIKLIVILGE